MKVIDQKPRSLLVLKFIFPRRTLVALPAIGHIAGALLATTVAVALMLPAKRLYAGSAAWNSSPSSGIWNTSTNWTPATVPNGASDTATFNTSNQTAISLSAITEVNGIVFNASASAFTITASPSFVLLISGVGITNNSGFTQNS